MKRRRLAPKSLLRRIWALLRAVMQPRHALPCVGLVVLGGCLTFIISPDSIETPVDRQDQQSYELPTVIVDPGHGGRDEGTKWRGVTERELTLDVALRVENYLKIAGMKTVLTRRDGEYVSLEERARLANSFPNAVFISIHFNSEPSASFSGVETHYAREKEPPSGSWTWIGYFSKPPTTTVVDTSETLAGAIQTAVVSRTAAKDRGIKATGLYVLHHTHCPAVLVEGGFISNSFEAQLLLNEAYRNQLAEGIVEGIMRYHTQRLREAPARPKLSALEHP